MAAHPKPDWLPQAVEMRSNRATYHEIAAEIGADVDHVARWCRKEGLTGIRGGANYSHISSAPQQMMDCNPGITKAQVAAAYDRKYGPVPTPVGKETGDEM